MSRPILRKTRLLVAVAALAGASLLAVVPSLAAPAAGAKTDPRGNPFGIQVIRVAPGTSPAAMRHAVSDSGAEVLTDLSALNAMAVVPSNAATFASKIKTQNGYRAAWVDHRFKSSALEPDPLHDLDSFAGEDAPGVLQWEDDRDGVVTRGAPRAGPASRSR